MTNCPSSPAVVYPMARRLTLTLPRSGYRSCANYPRTSSGTTGDRQQLRYYTLGEYLQRLPRGIRDLLLWSPAMAAGYFMFCKQPAYFLPSAGRRLLSRPANVTSTPVGAASATGGADGGEDLCLVQICKDDACGTVVDGVLLNCVDDYKELGVTSSTLSSPPIQPFCTGAVISGGSLCIVRDASTKKVVGYKFV